MERIPYRPEITFHLVVERNQAPLYDIGIVVDPLVLEAAGTDALDAIFRKLGRRVAADWEQQLKSRIAADKEN